METYDIILREDGWTISHNGAMEGSYATKEAAFEAVYAAASNAIKKGAGVRISIDAPSPGESALGASIA